MTKRSYLFILITSLFWFSCASQMPIIKKGPTPKTQLKPAPIHLTPAKPLNVKTKKGNLPQNNQASLNLQSKYPSITRVPVINPPLPSAFLPKRQKSVKVETSKTGIKINVENMPINEFVNLVFAKILKTNYFLDKSIATRKDTVTLKMDRPVSKSQFLDVVSAILSRYQIAVQNKNGVLFIVPGRFQQEKKSIERFIVGRYLPRNLPDTSLVTLVVPVHYINARYYLGLISRLSLSRNASIETLGDKNAFVITDTVKHLRMALKLIKLFDRPSLEHKKALLIHLDYLDPEAFINKLKKILPNEGIPIASNPHQPGLLLIPMPEISSVIVFSSNHHWTQVVTFWKSKLDTVNALGTSPRFFIFYPQNRRAKDLAKVFSEINQELLSKKTTKTPSAITAGQPKVVVDEDRNALIILAKPADYKQIKEVLEKLDTLPKEVLIQTTIAEVTLTKNLQYGIEWYLKHSGKYTGVLQTLNGLGLGSSGLNYSLVTDTQRFQALLNAFARDNLINVISSPRLVVLDNHEATINVGTQVPVITSESSSANIQTQGTTSLLRTVEYRNTGVILNIKPTINSGGILTLDIDQEVSEPQVNTTSKIDSPLILNRSIKTSVVLKSGTTLLIGGLIKNNKSKTINKVPLLGDIPILGNLFKTTSIGRTKTELIIEITPYIIDNMDEAVQKTKHFESLLKWFKE